MTQSFGKFLEVFDNGNKLRLFKVGQTGAMIINSLGGITTERLKILSSRSSWRKSQLASDLPSKNLIFPNQQKKFWINSSSEISEATEAKSNHQNNTKLDYSPRINSEATKSERIQQKLLHEKLGKNFTFGKMKFEKTHHDLAELSRIEHIDNKFSKSDLQILDTFKPSTKTQLVDRGTISTTLAQKDQPGSELKRNSSKTETSIVKKKVNFNLAELK